MKKSKNNNFTFQLYQYPVYLTVNFVKELKCSGQTYLAENEQDIIVDINLDDYDREDLIDMIIHESVHIEQLVEQFIENRLDNESAAYFIQRTVRIIIKKMDAYLKTAKKCCII